MNVSARKVILALGALVTATFELQGWRGLKYGLEASVSAGFGSLSPLASGQPREAPSALLVLALLWAGTHGAKHPSRPSDRSSCLGHSLTNGAAHLVSSLDATSEVAACWGRSH